MRQVLKYTFITIAVLLTCVWAIIPPEKQLRLGKDLRGGVSLVYSVQIAPNEDAKDVMTRTIGILKKRVDPDGLLEVSMIQQGRDRIEITMPLPNDRIKGLKRAFEDRLAQLGALSFTADRIDEALRLTGAERDAALARLAGGSEARTTLLRSAAAARDSAAGARAAYDAGADDAAREALLADVGAAEVAYAEAREGVLGTALSAQEVRRVLQLSKRPRYLTDDGNPYELPSARVLGEKRLREAHPSAAADIDELVRLYDAYATERTTLDDPQDLIRLLKGAGVLSFRITVDPGTHPDEGRLRQELRDVGPGNVRAADARWYKINQIDNWISTRGQAEALTENPDAAGPIFQGRGYVVDHYKSDYYMLAWDTRGSRLTQSEGRWAIARAGQGTDQIGKPSITFEMNPPGAVLLGELTREHVGDQMAVLLDDEVYTAPNLQSAISSNGQITGDYSQEEIDYVVRVLSGGSLTAKMSSEPISQSSLGPELGADNLEKGLRTGLISFAVVSVFMVVYYFSCGAIAVVALAFTGLIILGAMALNKAAFTLPGITGIVLTFGQAVDANVLVYERMREELKAGRDMKTATRMGFKRATPSIVDANVANLIICFVLNLLGTEEIKGFAITLAVGVLGTLFSAMVVSRLIFTVLVDHGSWRKASMLPLAIPALQRALEPRVNWLRLLPVFVIGSSLYLVAMAGLTFARGEKMFDTEFRGGHAVTLGLKDGPDGAPLTMTRREAELRLRSIEVPEGSEQIRAIRDSEVLPINPQDDGVTSDTFRIKTTATDPGTVLPTLQTVFEDVIAQDPVLTYAGSEIERADAAPIERVISASLGETVGRPGVPGTIAEYRGGLAIVLDGLTPAVSRDALVARLERTRLTSRFSDSLDRLREVRVLAGTSDAVTSVAVLVHDPDVSAYDNEAAFDRTVMAQEWELVRAATALPAEFASVESISPAVADTFKANAAVSLAISIGLLIIYIWIRYGTVRWALAATLPLLHDVLGLIGLIALAQFLYEWPATQGMASAAGLLPFSIDLNMVAAILTMAGFSLNDKIIILDRIRENRGKAKYASSEAVNNAINQTLSRTFITSGTTLIVTTILYLYGGEGVRGFAYAFTMGVILGTYSSIAIAAPFVWSRRRPGIEPSLSVTTARPVMA